MVLPAGSDPLFGAALLVTALANTSSSSDINELELEFRVGEWRLGVRGQESVVGGSSMESGIFNIPFFNSNFRLQLSFLCDPLWLKTC